ncbi:MAG: 2Fe-2S iron-sulfur cluster-binding protein [Proteobacteria bacterium]|nr:2Fe-2S iron-sulfur cluster-binding protein [Pseudomonadota bacterium]
MNESRAYRITIADSDEDFLCKDGQNVLRAMERLGRKGIPVGCRGGGCGICRVQVLDNGRYRTLKMSRAQISIQDEASGMCLACKLIPQGDLRIQPLGLLRKKLNN